jgi:hypothetical protein
LFLGVGAGVVITESKYNAWWLFEAKAEVEGQMGVWQVLWLVQAVTVSRFPLPVIQLQLQ